jgi:SnoaL-like domain
MKLIQTFLSLILLSVAIAPVQADSSGTQNRNQSDITTVIPSGPILLPGVKFPYMDPNQLYDVDHVQDVIAITQLWAAYVFYHDTFDPVRFASLFLPDGIFDQEWNNGGTLVPASGIGGNGCVLRGRAQIEKFISLETNGATPLTFPGPSHHKISSPLIKVDGDTATLVAPWFSLSFNTSTGANTVFDGGTYLVKFQRTNQGWLIQANHVVFDFPRGSPPLDLEPQPICTLNGPIN